MPSRALGSRSPSCRGSLAGVGTVLFVAACHQSDVTRLEAAFESGEQGRPELEGSLASETGAAELALAWQANQAELSQLAAESDALAATLAGAELDAALAGAPLPSLEALREEREALATAALTAGERTAILAALGPGRDDDSRVAFQGRLVLQGDVLRRADDVLAGLPGGVPQTPLVAKGNLHLSLATNATDRNGNPIPGGPARPDLIAKVEDGRLFFWRPDLERRYFIVVPSDVPDPYFYAFVVAVYALQAAVASDCLANLLAVIRQDAYAALHPVLRARSSVIEVGYSTTACLNLAAGCANSPRLEELSIRTGLVENRMRLGSYIGLETDYDSRDADSDPDLTPERARNVILHELSHILGFDHPIYSELDSDIEATLARVPQSSQGTVPTFMVPTASRLFSPLASAEDRRVLSRLYAGQPGSPECSYRAEFRLLGELCSVAGERRCLAHGGSCEVARGSDESRFERCRWHNFTDAAACARYSAGVWETENDAAASTVFAGEAGACLASELSECLPDSFLRTELHSSGRCCTLFGDDERGLLFEAFSDAGTTHYYCSEQKGLGDPGDSWEFFDAAEALDFTLLDAATGGSTPGWSVLEGDHVQELELPGNLALSRERMRSGCVTTHVTADGAGESGIVFNFRTPRDYYVFDAIPNVRRRIRQVVDGVSTDLSVEPWAGPASWTSIGLSVCYGDGIHTFIDDQLSSRVSVDQRVDFVGTGGRVGLWNDLNPAARHAYLRTYSLVEGYALVR